MIRLCPDLDDDVVQGNFDWRVIQRGAVYAMEDRVESWTVDDGGHDVRGTVRGTAQQPYVTRVKARHSGSRIRLDSWCSCRVGSACKHAVALLLTAMDQFADAAAHRDPRVDAWMRELDVPAASSRAEHVVSYEIAPSDEDRTLVVRSAVARRKKDGTLGAPRPLELAGRDQSANLGTEYIVIARLLSASPLSPRVHPAAANHALELIVASGHARWAGGEHPLVHGEPRAGTLFWETVPDGRQRPTLAVNGETPPFLLTDRAWALDDARAELYEVLFDAPREDVLRLLRAPAICEDDIPSVAGRLAPRNLPVPNTAIPITMVNEAPVTRLRLARRIAAGNGRGKGTVTGVGRLTFHYGSAVVGRVGPEEFHSTVDGAIVIRKRDRKAEERALELLARYGVRQAWWADDSRSAISCEPSYDVDEGWWRFLTFGVEPLRAAGWTVAIDDDFPYRPRAIDETPWVIALSEASRVDGTLGVDISISVDGRPVSLVPLLVDALRRHDVVAGRDVLVGPLPDGSRVLVPGDRVKRMLDALAEAFDAKGGALRVAPSAAAALGGEVDVRFDGRGAARVRELASLAHEPPAHVVVPAALQAKLRGYQHDGLNWMQRLRAMGLGGILADSMGLGKTVQTLAHLLAEREAGRLTEPALVVAPTSVLPNWLAEAARFAPSLRTLLLHGADRAARHPEIAQANLVVTSYALLARDADALASRAWSVVVLDEAQQIKNPATKAAQTARRLLADQRLCLTGTPIENNLDELWSLFAFVDPAVLGDRARFRRLFRSPIERDGNAGRQAALAARIAPFILRRTKERVATELPSKTEIVQRVELGTTQRDLYETLRAATHERVRAAIAKRGLERSRIVVLDALLKLRQTCCDPRLLPLDAARGAGGGAKLEALLDMLDELLAENRRVIVFSQFTSMLALIEEELRARHIPYVLLTGATKDRSTPVQRFQAGEVPLFLISLKAGGTGLNLTAADTVIHYDPWWNPAVEVQATDRAHRIGQTKPVFVYKLICERTVEERIVELQARKGAVADALLDGDASALGAITAEEVDALFAR